MFDTCEKLTATPDLEIGVEGIVVKSDGGA
jgi:hypothetical protein